MEAYVAREITAAEADALGFGVSEATDALQTPIDAALSWRSAVTEGGGPASGYEPETHVRGAFDVRSYVHYRLDDARCDETTCMLTDGTRTERVGCWEYVLVMASGEIATDDGAIEASFPVQAISLVHLDPLGEIGFGGSARVDLSEVHGSLRLDPDVPEPRKGALDLSLDFRGKGQRGALNVSVYPDWDHRPPDAGEIPSELSYYSPIEGRWGDWSGVEWPQPAAGMPTP